MSCTPAHPSSQPRAGPMLRRAVLTPTTRGVSSHHTPGAGAHAEQGSEAALPPPLTPVVATVKTLLPDGQRKSPAVDWMSVSPQTPVLKS